jgi:twinkle protein
MYDDGYHKCFSCGHYGYAEGSTSHASNRKVRNMSLKQDIEYSTLKKRGLTEASCRKWGYGITQYKGKLTGGKTEKVQVATYCDASGTPVAQKLRSASKDFTIIGDTKHNYLYGMHLWRGSGKRSIIITEGEIDAISISQIQEHKYPVVSIPKGADGAKGCISHNLEYLEQFEKVVFCFDMDKPGQDAAKRCAALLSPGKAFIMELPLKDANEVLVKGNHRDLVSAFFNAKPYAPDGMAEMDQIIKAACTPMKRGISYPWGSLDDLLLGIRTEEIITLGAGVGVGKTDFMSELIASLSFHNNVPLGVFSFEINPAALLRVLATKISGTAYHLPGSEFSTADLERLLNELKDKNTLHLYNHVGVVDWDKVVSNIRYLKHAHGVSVFIVDNLTQLATGRDVEERLELERIMGEAGSLVQELGIAILFVSHLVAPDKGLTHEEGGTVLSRHFKGSRAIQQWSHVMLGLERNTLADTQQERCTTTVRILKNRNVGMSVGSTKTLYYNPDTYRLTETPSGILFEEEDKPPTDVDEEFGEEGF